MSGCSWRTRKLSRKAMKAIRAELMREIEVEVERAFSEPEASASVQTGAR
jgi:hypothetical protein